MSRLTQDQFVAMAAHRADYIAKNPSRCNTERKAERNWRDHLTIAWLNDYAEQRGILRTVRNDVGIQEAFEQFAAMRNAQTEG